MLVQPARTEAEQNFVAAQLQQSFYFISTEVTPLNVIHKQLGRAKNNKKQLSRLQRRNNPHYKLSVKYH